MESLINGTQELPQTVLVVNDFNPLTVDIEDPAKVIQQ